MKKCIAAIVLFLTVFIASCGYHRIDTLTYAVYPYIPDAEYYQEIIERRWKEIEPNIKLVRADGPAIMTVRRKVSMSSCMMLSCGMH